MFDWASVEAALTVKAPPAEGRKKMVPEPLSQALAETPLKVTVGVEGTVVSTRIVAVVNGGRVADAVGPVSV